MPMRLLSVRRAIPGRLKPTPRSCGGHALESDEATDIVDEVLQSDLGSRSDDADCSYEAASGVVC